VVGRGLGDRRFARGNRFGVAAKASQETLQLCNGIKRKKAARLEPRRLERRRVRRCDHSRLRDTTGAAGAWEQPLPTRRFLPRTAGGGRGLPFYWCNDADSKGSLVTSRNTPVSSTAPRVVEGHGIFAELPDYYDGS
jgi:hypothetical protein